MATVKKNWITTSTDANGVGTSTHYLQIEFQAKHSDGSVYIVDAEAVVLASTYKTAEESKLVEVLYPVNDERDFQTVGDVEKAATSSSSGERMGLGLFVCIWAFSLVICIAAVSNAECFVGFASYVALLAIGVLVGYYIVYPLSRKTRRVLAPISVTPCVAPVAIVIGSGAAPSV